MHTTFSEMQKNLRERWNPHWPKSGRYGQLLFAFNTALSVVDNLASKKARLVAANRYSHQGVQEESRSIAQRDTVPGLKKAAFAIEDVQTALDKQRQSILTFRTDPADTIGAIMRGEMRTWLRSLPHGEAMQKLLAQNGDERLVAAVLEAPSAMSGLTEQMAETIRHQWAEKTHKAELTTIEEMNEAISLTRSALEICLFQLRRETGFNEGNTAAFDSWMNEISTEVNNSQPAFSTEGLLEDLMADARRDIDEIFAKTFPAVYQNHPVNKVA